MPASVPDCDGVASLGVLIVAEIRLHQDGLVAALRRRPALRVLACAGNADDAVARARSLPPDLILVDMVMRDGMRAVRALSQEVPRASILALSVPEAEEEVIACIEAGAGGCMTREASLDQVVAAVEEIARGEAPCSPRVTAALFRRLRVLAAGHPSDLKKRLTPREREIVSLIDEGLSNKQIAEALCIETATVKNHVHSILEKLHVSRRGEAAAAVRHGLGARNTFGLHPRTRPVRCGP